MKHTVFTLAFLLLLFAALAGPAAAEDIRDGKNSPLNLKEALIRGIENNLDIKITRMDIPISREAVTINESVFDAVFDAGIFSSDDESPVALSTTPLDTVNIQSSGASAGISKKTASGLSSRLSFETYRIDDNTPSLMLNPEYRNYLVLDFTQPLWKDFGADINTTSIKVAQNQQKQAGLGYISRVNQIIRSIETTYYELAKAIRTLDFQIESRELARTLLDGNRKKFDAGVVPVSEVQRAETAVASRDEQVLYARQQAEIISDRLKDLLDIRGEDPLAGNMIIPEAIRIKDTAFPVMEKALSAALVNRPELQQQALEIDNRDMKITYYANQKLPRIDLVATLGVNGFSGEKRSNLSGDTDYEGNYPDAFSGLADGDGYEWKVGLAVAYPWGNRAAKSRYHQAEQEKQRSLYQYKRIESTCETDVKNAWVGVSRSLARVGVAERFETLAAVTLDQEMKRLEQGLSDTFRILQYQDDLIDAKIRKITAIIDYNKGISDLYFSMGTILDHHKMKVHLPHQGE